MTFRLYQSETGGNSVWEKTIPNVQVSSGVFSVVLTPIDVKWWEGNYWLETEVANSKLAPREKITAQPYALHTQTAESIRRSSGAISFLINESTCAVMKTAPDSGISVTGTIAASDNIRVGNRFAVAAEENLRIIRGSVNGNGTIAVGTGFSVRRIQVGIYEVTFATPFSGIPTVVANQVSTGIFDYFAVSGFDNCVILAVASNRFQILCSERYGKAEDRMFGFVAIGPK